jgi:hypothetical protein
MLSDMVWGSAFDRRIMATMALIDRGCISEEYAAPLKGAVPKCTSATAFPPCLPQTGITAACCGPRQSSGARRCAQPHRQCACGRATITIRRGGPDYGDNPMLFIVGVIIALVVIILTMRVPGGAYG